MLPSLCLPIGVTYNNFDAAVLAEIASLSVADAVENDEEWAKADAEARRAEVERREAGEKARLQHERNHCSICTGLLVGESEGPPLEGYGSEFHLKQVDRLSCNHYFHTNCICHWTARNRTGASCPICRRPIVIGDEDWKSLSEARPGFLDEDAEPIVAEESEEEEEEDDAESEVEFEPEELEQRRIGLFQDVDTTLEERDPDHRLMFLMYDLINRGAPHTLSAVVRWIVNGIVESAGTVPIRAWDTNGPEGYGGDRFPGEWPVRPNDVTWLDLLSLMGSNEYAHVFDAHEMNDLNRAMGEVFERIGRAGEGVEAAAGTRAALVDVGMQMIECLRRMPVQVRGVRRLLEYGPNGWSGVLVVRAVGNYLNVTSLELFLRYARGHDGNYVFTELHGLDADERNTALTYFFGERERVQEDDEQADPWAQEAQVQVVAAVLRTGRVTGDVEDAAFTLLLGDVHQLDYDVERLRAHSIVHQVLGMLPDHTATQAVNFLMNIVRRAPRMLEMCAEVPGWGLGADEVTTLVRFAVREDLRDQDQDSVSPMRTEQALRFEPYFRAQQESRGTPPAGDWEEKILDQFQRATVVMISPVAQFLFGYLANRGLGQRALLAILRRADGVEGRAIGVHRLIAAVLEYAHEHVDAGVMQEVSGFERHDPPVAEIVRDVWERHPEWEPLPGQLVRSRSSESVPRDPKRART